MEKLTNWLWYKTIWRNWKTKNRARWRLHYWMFIRLWLYKNHYRVIAVDFSKQKEVDADPKAIQKIEFVGQLKKLDGKHNATDAGNDQSMFVLTILEKK